MHTVTLESICSRISSGGTPSRKNAEYFTADPAGHFWVKSKELLDCSISATEEKITEEGFNNSAAKYFPENSVLIAMYGANVGQLGWLRKPATVNQAISGLVVDDKKADWRFVFYSLLQNRGDLTIQAQGAAQQNLNQDLIRQFQISVPPLPVQRRIAGILSAYDELMENSQRRIRILEAMARALYREWFVHFRFPGHEKRSSPAGRGGGEGRGSLVTSPLGDLPKGWEVKPLSALCSRMESGGTPKRKSNEYWDGGEISWFKTGELWDGFLFESEEKITELGQRESNARLFEPGTLLMAIYGSPTVGRLGIVTQPSSCNQAALGLVADSRQISQTFLYFVLLSLRDHFNGMAQGAAQQNISKEKVAGTPAVVPPRALITAFDRVAEPMFAQLQTLQRQIQNLRRTRDLLLPRLLSGQVELETEAA